MNFCSKCGYFPLEYQIPVGDVRKRFICSACQSIHYQNPRNIVGTLTIFEDKVLLCKRAIEPRVGYWTLPAGYMELGETTSECAVRETFEETGVQVKLLQLFSLQNVPHVNQVHIFYLAQIPSYSLIPILFNNSNESLEVKFFEESSIPWNNIAFVTISKTLKYYFSDKRYGIYYVHDNDVSSLIFNKK